MRSFFIFTLMISFLEEVIEDLFKEQVDITECIYVLPSKRAGTFLKKIISKKIGRSIISPTVYSIEEFVEDISNITFASPTQQLFELYRAYLQVGSYEKESFESFLAWGQTLLQDINEIDRYLVNPSELFSGLSAIQQLNHWSLQDEKTDLMKNYLDFWKQLDAIYQAFNTNLLEQDIGHQGLVYRIASKKIQRYIQKENKPHILIGFNALNTAESEIIQCLLSKPKSKIYWDIDEYFLADKLHDAGLFLRKHLKSWNYFASHKLKGKGNIYLTPKHIEVIGVPKNISQSKYVGTLLDNIQKESSETLQNAALILGDESLLNPMLNSIPKSITSINITMGQKLSLTGTASFFTNFLDLHLSKTKKGWFFKNIVAFLINPYTSLLLKHFQIDSSEIVSTIHNRNLIYLSLTDLNTFIGNNEAFSLLFAEFKSISTFLENCNSIINSYKNIYIEKEDYLVVEQLYKVHTTFNQISDLVLKYDYINSLKGLKSLFQQLITSETLDFQGDPMEGLQIMGMLESRNLDFETVILTSVNEGILPSGKSNNSFIPFDLKIEFGLPTYKEKDAVYTYHFYRLLQRAKNVYLLYNTEPDVLEGGEKSRLITQILTDENRKDIIEKIATPQIQSVERSNKTVIKTPALKEIIALYAIKGFSPTSLSNYIRNPIDFYKQNLLGIQDLEEVEEDIAANTMGTIIHDTLEELYTSFVGKEISKSDIIAAKGLVEVTVQQNFKKTYLDGAYDTGKNLIAYKVVIRYIQNFLDNEIELLNQHSIKILALEKNLKVELSLPQYDKKVILKGKLDRIDIIDGQTRIIDFKTGKVEKRYLEVIDWNDIIENYDYSKAFQLLCYSYMFFKTSSLTNIHAGIVSIKNLSEGVMLFHKKDSPRDTKKDPSINKEVLQKFEDLLFQLIGEILDTKIPFSEKET